LMLLLLFLMLHYSCCFVASLSCIAIAWCFIAPLPPCPNWYSPPPYPPLFFCSVLDI
jgi:hypothetical protein